jgi:hypothetical protein
MIYAIIQVRNRFKVKYFDAKAYAIKELAREFTDPGEASQEFKNQFPGTHENLTPTKFVNQAEKLQQEHREDLRKLSAWNNG